MPIEKVYVSEMMSIIDAKATLEEDKIKAYNYLNFCRLLAIMLDSKERTSYYDSRLTLLEVLNDFATLDKVDINKIEHIAHGKQKTKVILFPDKNAPRCAANFSFWLT